jgi:hypothetical protein
LTQTQTHSRTLSQIQGQHLNAPPRSHPELLDISLTASFDKYPTTAFGGTHDISAISNVEENISDTSKLEQFVRNDNENSQTHLEPQTSSSSQTDSSDRFETSHDNLRKLIASTEEIVDMESYESTYQVPPIGPRGQSNIGVIGGGKKQANHQQLSALGNFSLTKQLL